jgi:hypothetical protein
MRTSEAQREIMMHLNHSIRTSVLGIVAMLNVAVFAPANVRAQEEILAAAPAIEASWDETSGYGAVEATRAAINALPQDPAVITSLVPSDVRWAPEPSIDAALSAEASRVAAAQQALLSTDLGSMQEEALLAVVAAGPTWDEMSGYGSVETTRAAISSVNNATIADEAALRAQFRAVELSMSSSLGAESNAAPLARGTRAESSVLWAILLDDNA